MKYQTNSSQIIILSIFYLYNETDLDSIHPFRNIHVIFLKADIYKILSKLEHKFLLLDYWKIVINTREFNILHILRLDCEGVTV